MPPLNDRSPTGSVPIRDTRSAGEVLVVIVNYCTPELTVDCLRSLAPEVSDRAGASVVVVDNASPDGSAFAVAAAIERHGWQAWAQVLPAPRNGGFAYGNNSAIRQCLARRGLPRFVWLLNSDTVVRPGALARLLEFMDQHPDAGIAGSRLEDPDGTQQCSAFRFHTVASELEASAGIGPLSRLLDRWAVAPTPSPRTERYDWVSGASMLIRREVIEDIGLLDESYFLYFEETDFCRRAAARGWTCWQVGDSRVVHLVGQSSGVTDRSNQARRRSPYWFESRRTYFEKHHGRIYAVAADAALSLGTLLARSREIICRRERAIPQRFLSDLMRHSALWMK